MTQSKTTKRAIKAANRIAFACRLPAETLAVIKREAAVKGISEANVIVGWAVAAECHEYVVKTGNMTEADRQALERGTSAQVTASFMVAHEFAARRLAAGPEPVTALPHVRQTPSTELRTRRAGAAPIKRPGEK